MIPVGPGHPKDDQISLLQCLLEQCEPPRHDKAQCDTKYCRRCEFDHWKKELEAQYKPRPQDTKAFPMLEEPRAIPWGLGLAIWETLYEPLYHDQTVERLAQRGGFGWDEVKLMAREAKKKGLL